MDVLKITEGRLKISLSPEEMEEWGVLGEEDGSPRPPSRARLRRLLQHADRLVGFPTEGSRLLIQLFSSLDGGCELFVSCVDGEEEPFLADPSPSAAAPTVAFGFERLEWLLCVCRRLLSMGFCGDSRTFLSSDRRYYLFLGVSRELVYFPLNELSFILEFGFPVSAEEVGRRLEEHGTSLCAENAVGQLGIL